MFQFRLHNYAHYISQRNYKMKESETFSFWLTERLKERGWSQADLARAMRTTSSTVKRWVDGSTPHTKTMAELKTLLKDNAKHVPSSQDFDVTKALSEVFEMTLQRSPSTAINLCKDFITQARGGDSAALEKAELMLQLFLKHLSKTETP